MCTSSLDCSEPGTRCRGGRCVPIDGNDAGAGEGDAGVTPGGCGNGPACSDRTIAGRPIERCVDGECRQSCIGDRMCRGDTPICVEVADESGEVGRSSCANASERTTAGDRSASPAGARRPSATVTATALRVNCATVRASVLSATDASSMTTARTTAHAMMALLCAELRRSGALRRRAGLRGGSVRRGDHRSARLRTGSTLQRRAVRRRPVEPHRIVIVTPYGVCAGGSENACRLPLALGADAQLTAMALDVNGQGIGGQAFAWSSDAANVASVGPQGAVRALAGGEARIDVAVGQLTADRTVQVVVVPAPQSDRITVLDERGRGLAGARIAIDQGQGWRYQEGVTDGAGQLDLDGLRAGGVNLSIHTEGYEQTMLVGGVTKAGDPLGLVVPVM